MRTAQRIRYVGEPKHVREVTLTGTADFGFWSDYLKAEGLTPMRCGDAAQILVVSAEMVYLGVRFTEVSFSVRTVLTQDGSSAGMRLLHAFTSSRVFAWCERTMFATPYSHGACRVSVQSPPSVRLDAPGGCVLSAEMFPLARSATRAGDESWEGPVFLPPRGAAGDGRLFFGPCAQCRLVRGERPPPTGTVERTRHSRIAARRRAEKRGGGSLDRF